jgi:hypothetical protein
VPNLCQISLKVPEVREKAGLPSGHSCECYGVLGREKALPLADTPNVDMHEVGAAIVAHSSAMQAQGSVTQLRRRNPSPKAYQA